MKRPLLALALTVPLVLTGCSQASSTDDATTGEGTQDNQVDQPPLPEGVEDVAPTPGDDVTSPEPS